MKKAKLEDPVAKWSPREWDQPSAWPFCREMATECRGWSLVNTEQLYSQAKVAWRCHWTNFWLLRHNSVLDCSPSLLCHLPAKSSTAVKKLVNKLRVSVFARRVILCSKSFSSGSPISQDFRWGSLSVLFIITLQGQVHKYVNDQGKKVCLFGEYYIFLWYKWLFSNE